MKRIFQLLLIAISAIGIVSCGSDKDPLQLFFESDFAANKNNTAEFTITFENLAPNQKEKFSSKIFVSKASENAGAIMNYRIEESSGVVITFDGKKFIVTDNTNKQVSVSQKEEMASKLAMELSQSFYMIIDNKVDTAEIRKSTKDLKLLGTVDVNGEKCFEVSQKANGHQEYNVENHYFFSTEDKLMKKYTSKITDKNKKEVQAFQFTISQLKLNEKLPADLFSQTIDTVKFKFQDLDKSHDMQGAMGQGEPTEPSQDPHGEASGLLQTGTPAPDWTLLDAKGNKVTLSQLKGKVVVLDFWATWCTPCKKVMPIVQKLSDKYKSQNVLVFGVNAWERGDAPKFMKDNKYTYGLLLKGDDVAMKYKVEGIPTLYIIDKTGKIAFSESGATENFEQNLEAAIKKSL